MDADMVIGYNMHSESLQTGGRLGAADIPWGLDKKKWVAAVKGGISVRL